MLGMPVSIPRDINPIEYITVLLGMLQQVMPQIEALSQTQMQGVEIPLAEKLAGFFAVANHIQMQIQQLAQDEALQEQAKAFEQAIQQFIAAMQVAH